MRLFTGIRLVIRPLGWIVLLLASLSRAPAADNARSERAFAAASNAYEIGLWDRAGRLFAEFAATFPESARLPDALLLQARSHFQLKQYEEAITLLTRRKSAAGPLADQFQFWTAEAEFARGEYAAAARAYADLLREFPRSDRKFQAAYGQAFSLHRAGELAETIRLLTDPAEVFATLAAAEPDHLLSIRGRLLLGESLFRLGKLAEARAALDPMPGGELGHETEWERQFWLGMIERGQDASAALARATNLIQLATTAASPALLARSHRWHGEILESHDLDAAVVAYSRSLASTNISPSDLRDALARVVSIRVGQQRPGEAARVLEEFVSRFPDEPEQASLRTSLGELLLEQFRQTASGPAAASLADQTNLLARARAQLEIVTARQTNSPLAGRAWLHLGWTFWEESVLPALPSRLAEAEGAFTAAAARLPKGGEQAVALRKAGDCMFEQRAFTNALQTYRGVLRDYASDEPVRREQFAEIYRQILRACLELRDAAGAREALDRLLADFPTSSVTDHALLTYGTAMLREGRLSEAREAFVSLRHNFPRSPHVAEAVLGLARAFDREGNVEAAIPEYLQWFQTHTNDVARSAGVALNLMLAYNRSGDETNALRWQTNLVAQFPAAPEAAVAQSWLGDHYYSKGNWDFAALSYKSPLILANTNAALTPLRWHARLMTARAALRQQAHRQARDTINALIEELKTAANAPVDEAYLLRGQIEKDQPTADLSNYREAITAFNLIGENSPLRPRARLHTGDCYLQLGLRNPDLYANALREYSAVTNAPAADSRDRSQALFSVGFVLEKQSADPRRPETERRELAHLALDHYANLLLGVGFEPSEPDSAWAARAGLNAGALAESLGLNHQAIRLYELLLRRFADAELSEQIKGRIAEIQSRAPRPALN